ncbi:hypothetical protein [Lentilactobacillus senioris]|uniref:hypothetical protein n=1 Tax=Lentilactobacillus senioris TaxID=931534 RepID=UPI003D298FFC
MRNGFKLMIAGAFLGVGLAATPINGYAANVIEAPGVANEVKVVNSGNVLSTYSDDELNTVNNSSPNGNTSKKYKKYELDPNENITANTYRTISGSSQSNSFSTQWYLPDGFNVSDLQHGNFQSVALDDEDNIYFVESNGTGTNRGAIVKFNLSELNDLGLDTNITGIWMAFEYFNPYTDEGKEHNKEYQEAYKKLPFAKKTALENTIDKNELWKNNQVNYKNSAKTHYQAWKLKKAQYAKYTTSKYKPATRKKFKKLVTKAKNKMAVWMSSYQKHKQKVTAYNKKITGYKNTLAGYQKQIDDAKASNPEMFQNAAIAQTAQLSPLIDIGHGQTLTFNPANKHLYLAEDETLSDLSISDNNEVLEMDPHTLQPLREYRFKMLHDNSNFQLHTLAFDSEGNAYWGRKKGSGYMLFHGRLDENEVKFAPSKTIVGKRGGNTNQFVAVNPQNNRVYFVSDDILTSIPADKVRDGVFSAKDIHYQVFNSKREFEGLAFDQSGYGYLLMLWPPELMKSSQPLN